jgi:hypothetical protein
MKNVRIVASILHYVSKAWAVFYFAIGMYAAGALSGSQVAWLKMIPGDRFIITLPFTDVPFLIGDYDATAILLMGMAVLAFGIFAWLLSGVFQVFRQQKLFTRHGVQKLTTFYQTNLLVPPGLLVLSFFFFDEVQDLVNITVLHGIIGVFAYFLASIFDQGVTLQDEQDFTL